MEAENVKDFEEMVAEMEAFEAQRETVIKESRDILKSSKQAIFALHRGEDDKAASLIAKAEGVAQKLLPIAQANPELRRSLSGGLEEYAEAVALRVFLHSGKLVTRAQLPLVNREEYLGGVCDLTGEMQRLAVRAATKRDVETVEKCRDLVDSLLAELMKFSFSNRGNLRKKYDSVKYALRKFETLLYELSLTNRPAGGTMPEDAAEPSQKKQKQGEVDE